MSYSIVICFNKIVETIVHLLACYELTRLCHRALDFAGFTPGYAHTL